MKSYYKLIKNLRESYITTLAKLFDYSTSIFSKNRYTSMVDSDYGYTFGEFRKKCIEISSMLTRYGIGAGDKVAILSQNHPNWSVATFSLMAFGRVSVPLLQDLSENEVTNIINHSGCKAIFVSKRLLPKLTQEIIDKLTLVIDIETFEFIKRDDNAFTGTAVIREPLPDDLATIIYTSGTTGSAKGVMLSHRNLVSNMISCSHAHKTTEKDRWLSILPMAHAYEFTLGVLLPMYTGSCVYYNSKPPTPSILIKAMKSVRPTVMLSVPMIIEKIYKNSVVPTINGSRILSWLKMRFPSILYWLVGMKVKKTFGGKIKFFGIGGSKLNPDVEVFLKKAKFPYAIGYGLTETSPLICNANTKQTHIGSTGYAAYNVDLKLININPETGEGEIVAKGDNVMIGYYKDPQRTREVFTDDGYFRTNDLATVDKKGRYYIKGRLKNVIIGPSGENIYPEEIEKVINDIDGVNESIVLKRDGRLIALVQFNDNVIDWNQHGEDKFFESIEEKKKLVMDYVNKQVSKFSKINSVEVMKDPFEKTATQKIRRYKYEEQENNGGAIDSEKKIDKTKEDKERDSK